MPRLPAILWALLTGDLVKLLLLTTTVLVGLIAFVAGLQPLADGKIGPDQAVRFMGLAVVPMLQFALPFASAFAATLTYHRFSSENEALAAHAGGVPHRSLLVPALLVGIALTGVTALLTQQVIPGFLRQMETLITRNVAAVVEGRIERGEVVSLGGFALSARDVSRIGPDPQVGAVDRLYLSGVLVSMPDSDPQTFDPYLNAETVGVWFFEEADENGPYTAVQLVAENANYDGEHDFNRSRGKLHTRRVRVPGSFSDDPKFYTSAQLDELDREPGRISQVNALRVRLARELARAEAIDALRARLTQRNEALLLRGDERLLVRAADLVPDERIDGAFRFRPLVAGDPVRVEARLGSGATRDLQARTLRLRFDDAASAGAGVEFGLEYEGVRVVEGDEGSAPAERDALEQSGVFIEGDPGADLLAERSSALLARALDHRQTSPRAPMIAQAATRLSDRIDDLRREVLSKRHERIAYSGAAALMVLIGAAAGLRLRDAMPLPVYLWSFLPALACVIGIATGQSWTHESGAIGLTVTYGSVEALAAVALVEFLRLRRH
ncbi:MAG: LptF/LptG family permease [Planctomycetota bacterium]